MFKDLPEGTTQYDIFELAISNLKECIKNWDNAEGSEYSLKQRHILTYICRDIWCEYGEEEVLRYTQKCRVKD